MYIYICLSLYTYVYVGGFVAAHMENLWNYKERFPIGVIRIYNYKIVIFVVCFPYQARRYRIPPWTVRTLGNIPSIIAVLLQVHLGVQINDLGAQLSGRLNQ